MDASDIISALYRHFDNYEYKLNNTYAYDWESDFFAQSKTGYFVECEVKVSRGDFFKDFEKDKHRLFKDVAAKKTHYINRTAPDYYSDRDDVIGRVQLTKVSFLYDGKMYGHGRYNWRTGKKNGKSGYWVNDPGMIDIRKWQEDVRAPKSSIKIKPIEKILCPHQFYFATPPGLIKVNELPAYAGLLEIQEGRVVRVIKRAPYLHKRPMDFTRILLKKYYNLWQYKVSRQVKDEIRVSYSESNS